MKPYLAHYNVQTGAGQTVLEHLQETAQLAQSFADVFGAGSLGYRCGALHDIGKSSAAFQKGLLEKGSKVDHSTAGALEAVKQGDCITAFCVAGHHGGLPDGSSKYADCATDSTLWAKCKRRPGKEIPNYDRDTIPPFPPAVLPEEMEQLSDSFSVSFLIRMLFSCLVDADFLNTERFLLNHAV
ncbi:MAG: CRISPR-associated endonuclease Cas3'' [Oscillospiraceae bacterium]|jgi:CRISPR-associated endonuclease/helicase Cas3